SPVAYWTLDDDTGTSDLAGDATLTENGVTAGNNSNTAVRGYSKGKSNVTEFSGSGEYLSTEDSDLNLEDSLTLEMWVRPLSFGTARDLITKMSGEFALTQLPDGRLQFTHGAEIADGTP